MTRVQLFAGVLTATLFLANHTLAGGFQLNEHGARAMAQGGAFAARASDGSAIYFNPAGLGFQSDASVYAGITTISPTISFYGPVESDPGVKTSMVSQTFTPFNVYLVAPVTDRLVVGIGAYNPFGLGTEWPDGWAGRFLTTKVDLKTYFVTPTASYRLTDQLSIGAGLNYVMGSVMLGQDLAVSSVALPTSPHVSVSMHATGVGYNVGLLYKPLDVLSVGASYRGSVKLDAKGNVSFNPDYAALALPTGGVNTTIKLPATGFVGVAWTPMKDLQVEADYQFIGWSSYDQLTLHFAADNSETVAPKNYQDTYMLRVGGEYTMDAFHFRAGYVYDHSPVKTEYVDPLLPDANRNGVSLGLGYDITNHLSVDAAYFYLKFDQRVAVNTIPQTSFDGTYTSHAHLASVDFGYRF